MTPRAIFRPGSLFRKSALKSSLAVCLLFAPIPAHAQNAAPSPAKPFARMQRPPVQRHPARQEITASSPAIIVSTYLTTAKTLGEQCELLLSWLGRIRTEYPNVDLHGTPLKKLVPLFTNIYRDEYFIPLFGTSYDRTDQADRVKFHREVVRRCYGRLGNEAPYARQFREFSWFLDGPFLLTPSFTAIANIVAERRKLSASMKRALETSRTLPATPEGLDKLRQYRASAKQEYAVLFPSEVAQFEKALAERESALTKASVATWLAEMKSLDASSANFSKIPAGLRSHAKIIDSLQPGERAALQRELAAKMNSLLADYERNTASLQPTPAFLSDLKTLDTLIGTSDDAAASDARERIARVLTVLVGKKLAEIDGFPGTPEGLASYSAWQADFHRNFDPFAAYEPVKRAQPMLADKAEALGTAASAGIRSGLSGYLGIDALKRAQASIAAMAKSVKNAVLSKSLWDDYERAVTRWMQKETDSTAPRHTASASTALAVASVAASTARAGVGFLSPNLAQARLIGAIYRKDFGAIYKDDPDLIGTYMFAFIGAANKICSGTVPASLIRAVMRERSGIDLPTASRDDLVNLGAKVLQGMGGSIQNPRDAAGEAATSLVLREKADADAKRIRDEITCGDPAWKTYFSNYGAYLRNPTEGMNPADLSLAELCAQKFDRKFCACAGSVMEQELSDTQQKFVHLNPAANISVASNLLPNFDSALNRCR